MHDKIYNHKGMGPHVIIPEPEYEYLKMASSKEMFKHKTLEPFLKEAVSIWAGYNNLPERDSFKVGLNKKTDDIFWQLTMRVEINSNRLYLPVPNDNLYRGIEQEATEAAKKAIPDSVFDPLPTKPDNVFDVSISSGVKL